MFVKKVYLTYFLAGTLFAMVYGMLLYAHCVICINIKKGEMSYMDSYG